LLSVLLHRILNLLQQDVWLHGLCDIVGSTRLHGEHCILHLRIICHHDERRIDVVFVHPCEQSKPVVVGQTEVGEYKVYLFAEGFSQQFHGSTYRCRFLYLKSLSAQPCL
jgi:hypothetical protein